MDIFEYNKVKSFDYFEYCNYLNNKYTDKSKSGLFKHHYYEYRKANLSHPNIICTEEEKNTIVYCNFIEHLFLHILIGEQTDSRLALGLGGAINYIIPQINKYLDFGVMDYSSKYYTNIDRGVFNILCERCDKCLKDTQIALDHNNQLYLEVEQTLNSKGKALVVLGTGLGKTTTALQYLWNNKCRALVVGPNKLIKSGWEEYSDWVDTITYQSFATRYLKVDYSKHGLVIIDEAHHAGFDEKKGKGAEVWNKGIQYLIDNSVVKVLGLTATPNRSDNIDIGNTLFDGCVCEGYAVEDGIEKGLIHPFSYVTALYNVDEIVEGCRDCNNRELVGQLDLAIQQNLTLKEIFYKYMPTDKKRKGIIFIQDINDEQYVKNLMSDCYPDIEYRAIHSKMKKEEVDVNREWFENTNEGYLLAVNMISEGAHYKGVNTLIMFRKTSSYLVYTQQLGRIITLTKDENPNAIVFDLVNNIDSIEYNNRDNEDKRYQVSKIIRALEKSPMIKSNKIIIADESRDIVNAIRNIKKCSNNRWTDDELKILLDYYNSHRNRGTFVMDQLLKLLPRKSKSAIYSKASELGIYIMRVDWTDEETQILQKFYPDEGRDVKKRLPNKTLQQIYAKARKLKLKRELPNAWSDEEIQILKDNYTTMGAKGVVKLLPNRSITQIKCYCNYLGIRKDKWEKQKELVLKEYNLLGAKGLKDKYPDLFTNISTKQLYGLARRSGLKAEKQIMCVELDRVFSTFEEAADFTHIKVANSISRAIRDNATAGGYHWCNADDVDAMNKLSHFKGKQQTSRSEVMRNKKGSKKVLCVETGYVYESINDVKREKNNLNISIALKYPNRTAGGYHWKYVEEEN